MDQSNAVFCHSVRARLSSGWHEQPCLSAHQASGLFDRLRTLNPAVPLQRLASGRVVEMTGVDPGPG